MATTIPDQHPLRTLFDTLTEKSLAEKLGWADFDVSTYLSALLVDFIHIDQLHRICDARGERVEAIVDLLYESEVIHGADSFDRERTVHRHIGDVTLFMAGLFPEYLRHIKTTGLIYHKDFLVDFIKTGKRSYGIVAEFEDHSSPKDAPLFRKLSEHFELCVAGLGFVRNDLDRMQHPAHRQAAHLLIQ
jgi:hypothetical protein